MNSIKLLSPAKINLYLDILGVRKDGHHLLRSIIQPVNLFDIVSIETTDGYGIELLIEGEKTIPAGNENLVVKAATKYMEHTKIRSKIRLSLKKGIPPEAGLGGGSSNAAATLYGLNKIFNRLDSYELIEIGAQLGADVPFFINCRTSLVEGIGDRISILSSFPLLNFIIVKPPFGLSTKLVYEKWDSMCSSENREFKDFDVDAYVANFRESHYMLVNELEKPAIQLNHRIQDTKSLLKNLGCKYVSMTGSGSAVFAIFKDLSEAELIFKYLENSFEYKTFLCKGISGWHRL